MKKLLIGLCSAAAGIVLTGCVATTEPGYSYGYTDYPATYVTPAPVSGGIWIEGDWYNDGGHWRRHEGHWERPPHSGARYHQGYWTGRHEWHRGEWR
jgi:hypothetical protein